MLNGGFSLTQRLTAKQEVINIRAQTGLRVRQYQTEGVSPFSCLSLASSEDKGDEEAKSFIIWCYNAMKLKRQAVHHYTKCMAPLSSSL